MNRKDRNKKRIKEIQKGQKERKETNKIRQEEIKKVRLKREEETKEKLIILSEKRNLEPPSQPGIAKMLSASDTPCLKLYGKILDELFDPEKLRRFFETGIIRVGEVTYLRFPEENPEDK